jgi:hypothetical protein
MSDTLNLRFHDIDAGWAKCCAAANDQSHEFLFGYCTPAFEDIAASGIMAALGRDYRIVFDDESTTTIFDFSLHWVPSPDVSRFRFETWSLGQYTHEVLAMMRAGGDWRRNGKRVLSMNIGGDVVALAILRELERVEEELGRAEFKKKWMQPWPARSVSILRYALESL